MRGSLLKATLAACALTVASGASMAGAIVTQWSYSNDATFTAASFGNGSGSTNGVSGSPDYELSWGAFGGDFQNPSSNPSDNRSALTIGNGATGTLTGGGPATGSVDTHIGGGTPSGSEIGVGINITHWNNPISGLFATLQGGTIHDTLTLTPVLPNPGPSIDAPAIDFVFKFLETPNAGPCAGGTATPCGDLFGLVSVPTLNLPFTYDGNQYLASILVTDGQGGASPIGQLLDAECTALGLAAGCQGWRTDEEAATTVQFGFSISTQPVFVPEPAALALMAFGLFGIGYRCRKTA